MTKILIVKLSAVGDVVHALPVLETLRHHLPRATIDWAVHPGASGLLMHNPLINKVVRIPRRIKTWSELCDMRNALRTEKYDIVIDLQGLTKSGLWAYATGAKTRIGFRGKNSRELNCLFFNKRIAPLDTAQNIIDINLSLLDALDIPTEQYVRTATIYASQADRDDIAQWKTQNEISEERFLIIDPFAGWNSKTWNPNNWTKLALMAHEEYGMRPLIIWGPGEEHEARQLAEQIQHACGGRFAPLVAPPTTLTQLAELFRQLARVVVAGDTGPMHIAAACGAPTVALFGPSCSVRNAPDFANATYQVLHDKTQPCTATFNRTCKHGHAPNQCMDTLTPDMAHKAVGKLHT